MANLREMCRCGHALSRHEVGCTSRAQVAVDPQFALLGLPTPAPPCPCRGFVHAYPVWEAVPPGVKLISYHRGNGLTLVECGHHTLRQRVGYPESMCVICKASGDMTEGWLRPVKLLAVVPEEASLF